MNQQVAAEMTKILDASLREWSRQARASLPGGGAAPSANGAAHPIRHAGEGFGLADDGTP